MTRAMQQLAPALLAKLSGDAQGADRVVLAVEAAASPFSAPLPRSVRHGASSVMTRAMQQLAPALLAKLSGDAQGADRVVLAVEAAASPFSAPLPRSLLTGLCVGMTRAR